MLTVRFARESDVAAISTICSEAWRVTYADLYSEAYIEKVIVDFYNHHRISKECQTSSKDWHGYIVAERNQQVVGCIGGGCDDKVGFVYVLYIRPDLKGQGIGKALLTFLTDYQKKTYRITSQEVYATTGNMMGIPFYEKQGFELVELVPNWIDATEGISNHYRRPV